MYQSIHIDFQHCVLVYVWIVAKLIPDVPSDLKVKIKQEKHLIREMMSNKNRKIGEKSKTAKEPERDLGAPRLSVNNCETSLE